MRHYIDREFCRGCGLDRGRKLPPAYAHSAPCYRCGSRELHTHVARRRSWLPWKRGWVDREGKRVDVPMPYPVVSDADVAPARLR